MILRLKGMVAALRMTPHMKYRLAEGGKAEQCRESEVTRVTNKRSMTKTLDKVNSLSRVRKDRRRERHVMLEPVSCMARQSKRQDFCVRCLQNCRKGKRESDHRMHLPVTLTGHDNQPTPTFRHARRLIGENGAGRCGGPIRAVADNDRRRYELEGIHKRV
jgi:hypothetical protein